MTQVVRVNVPGYQGPKGDIGDTPTITVGSVTTLDSTANATVANSGTTTAVVLDFGIPQGATGATGPVETVNSVSPSSGDVALTAADVPFTPPEGMTATDVQAAIEEIFALVST